MNIRSLVLLVTLLVLPFTYLDADQKIYKYEIYQYDGKEFDHVMTVNRESLAWGICFDAPFGTIRFYHNPNPNRIPLIVMPAAGKFMDKYSLKWKDYK